ncbi:MAG: SAM-dependent methyltransferase [Lachnospiraceae bacterium]|nr:SAM-dependent methyltransferase [Lachnospiraceae bacterium]
MPNNCQIPTPIEYAKTMLDYAGYQSRLYGKSVLENSCGEGNILCEITRRYIEDAIASGYSKTAIVDGLERDIEAYEIDKKKVDICINNLNGILKKYDMDGVRWNIHDSDYLKSGNKKYCYIIGNPPYITYHDMEECQRKFLNGKYASCKKGRFDYCYAFMEKSLNSLDREGVLVYLVPYSIIKNKFGSELRKMILPYVSEIYDYSGIKIFSEATTSSIIMICKNRVNGDDIQYLSVKESVKQKYNRNALNDKWSFEDADEKERCFRDYFEVCNSVATLLNEAFLLEDYEESEHYILSKGCKIEKEVTYPAISMKSINKSKKNENKKLLIIFPYSYKNGRVRHFNAEEFQRKFPGASMYLKNYRDKLDERKKEPNAEWFEYGRSQALNRVFGRKIVMPMVITNSVNTYYGGRKAIPYAGYFIKCRRGSDLRLEDAKRILESKEFFDYVIRRGTPTTTTSYC